MKAYTYLQNLANRREAGQGSLEYLGVIVVAVLILGILFTAAPTLGESLQTIFENAISKISDALG